MGSLGPRPQSFLVFGNGYVGNQLKDILLEQGKRVVISRARIESREQVLSELKRHKPTRVINCAGVRGTPNADWCEDHKVETIRSNVLGALNVVDTCHRLGIHVTHIGSACIYTSTEKEPHGPFKETDEPFYAGSWYGRSRLLCEQAIRHYPNLLLLRIRIPIGADLHKNNHVARMLKFEKVVDSTGGSAIILSENDETVSQLINHQVTPGEISNVEIMQLAKRYIRPNLEWQTFGLDEMLNTVKAPRAVCVMDSTKLQKKLSQYGYEVKERREALEEVFQIMTEKGL
ncbi:MAG: hypothetical protein LQ348_003775 [Seirophora lacunosa]|nr:MAG: hypothetical protein LQ348_003775 [Seirophora lacunosa]